MAHSTLLITVLLLTSQSTQELVPQGCSYETGRHTCDFQEWTPPLKDEDFDPGPLYYLAMTNVNGTIPAGAFSGLTGPTSKKQAYLYFYCDSGKTSLSRDIFTENLHWLTQLYIFDCYLETGLPSQLLENLKNLIYLMIRGGGIKGPVANDALAGLTNLQEVTVNAPIQNGELPPGFFSGLKSLTAILLTSSALDFIPPKWFDELVSLERIYLSNNNLQTLPPGLFDEVKSLTYVGLSGNPWNCSCEFTWLLDWSNITARARCSEPAMFVNVEVEDALLMIDCTPSTSTITPTSVSYTTEMTTAVSTIAESASPAMRSVVSSTLNQENAAITTTSWSVLSSTETATTLKNEWVTSTSPPTKIIAMSGTAKIVPVIFSATTTTTTTLAAILITTSTMRIPTTSWKTSTEEEIRATQFLSSLLSTRAAYAQTFYSSTPSGSASLNNSNTEDNSANGINNIGLLAGVGGALTALPVTATVLYKRACKNKGIKSINDAEEQGADPQSIDELKSS